MLESKDLENAIKNVNKGLCDGNCEIHEGTPILVNVRSDRCWGYFSYCENAIKHDRDNGFTVDEK